MMGRAISDIPDFKDTVEDFSPDRCALLNILCTVRMLQVELVMCMMSDQTQDCCLADGWTAMASPSRILLGTPHGEMAPEFALACGWPQQRSRCFSMHLQLFAVVLSGILSHLAARLPVPRRLCWQCCCEISSGARQTLPSAGGSLLT